MLFTSHIVGQINRSSEMTEEQQREKLPPPAFHDPSLAVIHCPLTNFGKVTCDTVWRWHKEVPPPAFQARGVEFSAVCWLRCPQLCHWKYSMSQGIQYWCSPVGNHHDDILTILASSWQLDHLVALALAGLLDVHLINKCQVKTHHKTVINSLREKVTRSAKKKASLVVLQSTYNMAWFHLPAVAVLGSQLGLVDKSGFGHLLSGLFEAGSVLPLPATDKLSYMNLIFLYLFKIYTCCWSTMCCPAWPPTLPSTCKAC